MPPKKRPNSEVLPEDTGEGEKNKKTATSNSPVGETQAPQNKRPFPKHFLLRDPEKTTLDEQNYKKEEGQKLDTVQTLNQTSSSENQTTELSFKNSEPENSQKLLDIKSKELIENTDPEIIDAAAALLSIKKTPSADLFPVLTNNSFETSTTPPDHNQKNDSEEDSIEESFKTNSPQTRAEEQLKNQPKKPVAQTLAETRNLIKTK